MGCTSHGDLGAGHGAESATGFCFGGGKQKRTWVDVTEDVEVLWAPMPGIGLIYVFKYTYIQKMKGSPKTSLNVFSLLLLLLFYVFQPRVSKKVSWSLNRWQFAPFQRKQRISSPPSFRGEEVLVSRRVVL